MQSFISEKEFTSLTEQQRVQLAERIHEDNAEMDENLDDPIQIRNSFYNDVVKRILDFTIALFAFILVLPINLVICIVTLFDVGRPVIFKQRRIGRNGKTFNIVKFRNMTNDADENGTLLMPEERITKWGRFVRKTSLDELLNLLCILKGDMSIIGPRPMPEKYRERFNKKHDQRHLVRPGLECPFLDSKMYSEGWQGRFENDLWYVQNVSFRTDVKMFFLLIKKVFSKKEREESANGKTGEFMGYDRHGKAIDSNSIPKEYLSEIISKHN